MAFSFFLWGSISLFLIGFWVWTSYTLFQQKKAWKLYAAKYKLRYRANSLMDSPELSGAMDGYQISIFATDHGMAEGRTRRMMTSIEISMQAPLLVQAAVASGGMVKIVEELDLNQEYRPDQSGWDSSYIARAREIELLETYLTPVRIATLSRLMKIKRSWVILIFTGETGLLRLDTPDALEDPKRLDVMVRDLLGAARQLELEEGEDRKIMSQRGKKRTTKTLSEKSARIEQNLALEEE